MGTDIEIHVEYKWEGAENYSYLCEFEDSPRYYGLFGVMANVRTPNDIEPLFEVRGFPMGLAQRYTAYSEECDHGPSYLTCDELSEVLKSLEAQGYEKCFPFHVLSDLLFSLKKHGAEESRIIFWFNS